MRKLAGLVVVFAACSAGDKPSHEAPDAGSTAQTLTIIGTVSPEDSTITPYTASGASAGSAAQMNGGGSFTLTIETVGAFDGYLKVVSGAANTLPTYVWPAAPLTTNLLGLSIDVLTPDQVSALLYQPCDGDTGLAFNAADGVVEVQVASFETGVASGIGSAAVSEPSGAAGVCYGNRLAETATDDSGLAFLLNVPASDSVTLNASRTGYAFAPTTIPVVAGAYTMTFIVEQ
jgi:hypothetical protein